MINEMEAIYGTRVIRVMRNQCVDCGYPLPTLSEIMALKAQWICICGRDNTPDTEDEDLGGA